MLAGDTLLLPKPGQAVAHLWVLLTNPDASTDEVLVVNLTTQRPHSDTTVILNSGDHPFVQHATVVNFSDARVVKAGLLTAFFSSGTYLPQAPVPATVLQQIQAGLLASPFTPNKCKDYFRKRPSLMSYDRACRTASISPANASTSTPRAPKGIRSLPKSCFARRLKPRSSRVSFRFRFVR